MAIGLPELASASDYGAFRSGHAGARESRRDPKEDVVQCLWYDQLFRTDKLATDEGTPLKILSPGFWNHGAGPDFKGAQLQFGDTLVSGDVEIHLDHPAWKAHGHGTDPRFNNVRLVAVLDTRKPKERPRTEDGRPIPCLLLGNYLDQDIRELAATMSLDRYPYEAIAARGTCASLAELYGTERMDRLLALAGDWRMLDKARLLRQRIEQCGSDQALYEAFMAACGYSRFKGQFRILARQLPYDRVVQLANQDTQLVETALMQAAGLFPDPPVTGPPPHLEKLLTLREQHLAGLRTLPLPWPRTGVRPINYPERRLGGAALFLARAVRNGGMHNAVMRIWREDMKPLERRRKFEALFPRAMGFWANHCTWQGKTLPRPAAPFGGSRVRSIIGNLFVPAGLAYARQHKDRDLEETVMQFYAALPKEADNHLLKIMAPRLFGNELPPRLSFRMQQGLLQMFFDWCEPNPSCRNCRVIPALDPDDRLTDRR